jgi:hypothetical protein
MVRIGILATLALAPALFGCTQDMPEASPYGPTPPACQQQAQRLGFSVLGVEAAPQQLPDGSTDYPVLVQWGNDGGVHLTCRVSGGLATIG